MRAQEVRAAVLVQFADHGLDGESCYIARNERMIAEDQVDLDDPRFIDYLEYYRHLELHGCEICGTSSGCYGSGYHKWLDRQQERDSIRRHRMSKLAKWATKRRWVMQPVA